MRKELDSGDAQQTDCQSPLSNLFSLYGAAGIKIVVPG